MCPGVVADQVSCVVNPPDQIPLRHGKLPDQKEGSAHVEPRQHVEQLRSAARVRPVVESQRDFARIGRCHQAAAEELRSRPQALGNIAGRKRCSSSRGDGGEFCEIADNAHAAVIVVVSVRG